MLARGMCRGLTRIRLHNRDISRVHLVGGQTRCLYSQAHQVLRTQACPLLCPKILLLGLREKRLALCEGKSLRPSVSPRVDSGPAHNLLVDLAFGCSVCCSVQLEHGKDTGEVASLELARK